MAELPEQTLQVVLELQQQLLKNVHQARATERILLDEYGDVENLQTDLNDLLTVAQAAGEGYRRLSILLLRVSEIQPLADPALLKMLFATIEAMQASLAAQQRSIEEVRQNWRI